MKWMEWIGAVCIVLFLWAVFVSALLLAFEAALKLCRWPRRPVRPPRLRKTSLPAREFGRLSSRHGERSCNLRDPVRPLCTAKCFTDRCGPADHD